MQIEKIIDCKGKLAKHIAKNAKIFMDGQEIENVSSWAFHIPEKGQGVEWIGFDGHCFSGSVEFDPIEMRNFFHSVHNAAVMHDIPRIS